jgi:hypothetical protein
VQYSGSQIALGRIFSIITFRIVAQIEIVLVDNNFSANFNKIGERTSAKKLVWEKFTVSEIENSK